MSAAIAVVSLIFSAALLLVPGGAFIAPFPFGVFLLALVGVFVGLENRSVRQHNPAMKPRRWRDDSS